MIDLLLYCLIGFVGYLRAENVCITPNGEYGRCIQLDQCESLIDHDSNSLITQSKCGISDNLTNVCCPIRSNVSSSHQRPSQMNVESSHQRPYESHIGSSYQRPTQSNFSYSYQTQENSGRFTADDLPSVGHCGFQIKERIVGYESILEDFPWTALIHYVKHGKSAGYFCGGALIHENYVITAAHCIRRPSLVKAAYAPDYVRLGENYLQTAIDCQEGECADPVQDIEIAETIVHDDYDPKNPSQHNDIALIRLARPAPYTDYIRPVCLPIAQHLRNATFDDVHLVVAGFGQKQSPQSDVKLKFEINGFNLEECKSIYRNLGLDLNSKQMCADQDRCVADSGGPLMGEDYSNPLNPYTYLAGVASLEPFICETSDFPGVYTRIDQYIDWILSHMRK